MSLTGSVSGAKSIIKSPRRMTIMPSYDQVLHSSHFADEGSEQDLLLDIPSNGSFPLAELLLPTSSFGAQASTSSSSAYPYFVRP